jgi:large subunit ribosomal protein L22
MKAVLRNYRQSPRKVRLVADYIRGKNALEAITELRFVTKRASEPIAKLIESALANAKENNSVSDEEQKNLFIKEIRVNEGFTLKRFMPRAMGRATTIRKRTSHVHIVLGKKEEITSKKTKAQKGKQEEKVVSS